MENKINLIKEFYSNKKILITGHTGFKGTWLTLTLNELGAKNIIGISLDPNKDKSKVFFQKIKNTNLKNYWIDIRDYKKLKEIVCEEKPEIIFHLAAQPLVLKSYEDPKLTFETNINGTLNILEIIRTTDFVKTFINVTTDKVYKNNEWVYGYRENEELFGIDPYSNSKSCVELLSESYYQSFPIFNKISYANVRAGNVIGGGDFSENRLIPDCIRAIQSKEKLYLRNPDSVRPYQHVLEPVFFYLILAYKISLEKELPKKYNIGPDVNDSLKNINLIKEILRKFNFKNLNDFLEIKNKGYEDKKESNLLMLDNSLIKNIFGWKPTLSLDECLQLTSNWYKAYIDNTDITSITREQIQRFIKKIEWF